MSTSKVKSRNVRPASTGRVRPMPRNGIPQNEPKKRVGNYLLGNTVGEGTFGKVKIAIHIPTGEKVAVKILEKKRIQDQADVRRVNREIKILKKARHSNIIQLYEVLDTPNSIYLMMENADGGEMFDYIVANRHVPERQACKFFHQILNGVEELHRNEITHRDLKPENLLLKNSPEGYLIKIVDFGLSNTHDGGRLLATACGSPCYAAPEMIAGKQYHGPAADTWSLGVILFALVCGHLPFEDPNTSNLYRKILSGEYKTPKWISPEVKDLIRKILETDPEKRLTIGQIREHQWCLLVPPHCVPKEEPNADEIEETRQEVYKRLEEVGLDVQSVMDAVSSHACNSLSAMYYLLMQKEQLKLRLSKKFSTNSTRPETSDRNLLSGLNGIGTKGFEKTSDPHDSSHSTPQGEVAAKPIHVAAKVGAAVKIVPKPQIPKLNIKPALQGGASNPLVSQSARVDPTPTQPRGHLAAIQNPPSSSAAHHSGAATARPVLAEHAPVQPSSSLQQPQQLHPVALDLAVAQEASPKRGVIIKGSTIESSVNAADAAAAGGVDLAIVANGLVQLPPVEAERPNTRRSRSRGGKMPEAGGLDDCRTDGPGMGKIPSSEAISVAVETIIGPQNDPVPPREPPAIAHVPREPPKSSFSSDSSRGGGSGAGGRRGKHLIQASAAGGSTPHDEASSSHPPSSIVPTPPSRPKPSAVTTLSDPRSIYQGRQGIGAKPIQPLSSAPRVPSAPSSRPPDVSARALAQKNKQTQQGGSISLAMEPTQTTKAGHTATSTINQSPPTVLVS